MLAHRFPHPTLGKSTLAHAAISANHPPMFLEQKSGLATWGAAAMILFADRAQSGQHSVHVPIPSRDCEPIDSTTSRSHQKS